MNMTLFDLAAVSGAMLIVVGVTLIAGAGIACVVAGAFLIVGAKAAS